jgi:tetratricopeptide repeat protein
MWYLIFIRPRRHLLFHFFFMGLCVWSIYVQLMYRIPGKLATFVLPPMGILATCLSAVVLITSLMGRTPIVEPFRRIFDFVDRWGKGLILAFACYGVFVLLNATWDTSPTEMHPSEILEISADEINFGRSIPYAWAKLRSWRTPQDTESVFLHFDEQDNVWPGQAVIVHAKQGYFKVPWLIKVAPDEEKRLLSIVKSIPTASKAWKDLTDLYVKQNRWPDITIAGKEYLKLNPSDAGFATHMGATLLSARRYSDAIPLLQLVADTTFDHEVYVQLGFALALAGRKPEGLPYINKAIDAEPNNFRGYYTLGKANLRTGDYAAAIPALEMALKLRPYYPEIEEDLRQIRSVMFEQAKNKQTVLVDDPH